MRALVLGVNGQDGGFLAEHLIRRGFYILGVGQQADSSYVEPCEQFEYKSLDLRNSGALLLLLRESSPDVVFHVAAVHGSAGTPYEMLWQDMMAVNMGSVQVVLEYLRTEAPGSSLVYASSGKVFGPEYPREIVESSAKRGTCLYTISKMGAQSLIDYYRNRHKVRVSSLFLFNHESYRRPKGFFIPTVVEILKNALSDSSYQASVNTLQFYCDWGSAEEYMDIAIDISERAVGEDFVLGSGVARWAESFVEDLFLSHGLDYRKHVVERQVSTAIQQPPSSYRVETGKLAALLGRAPEEDILHVCEQILEHDT